MSEKVRVGVLISGARLQHGGAGPRRRGDPGYPAEIALVLSNLVDAAGLKVAEDLGVTAFAIDQRPFGKDREAHERALDAELREQGVELVCLAGYMRILLAVVREAPGPVRCSYHPPRACCRISP